MAPAWAGLVEFVEVDAIMANLFDNNSCLFNGLGGSNQPDIC